MTDTATEKILICIDDTDDLDSIGTGELLENICAAMEKAGLGRAGFVTRHQLLISDRIAYTSHNSSMCCSAETNDLPSLLKLAGAYLEANCAPSSDPGLCVFRCGEAAEGLSEFGRRAQNEVLTKDDAYAAAACYPGRVFLSEHGGSGDGVIGALAGVGLRLTGNDGRIKGKIRPENPGEIMTASEFCRRYHVARLINDDGETAAPDELVRFDEQTKAVLLDDLITLPADRKDRFWIPRPKKKSPKDGK